MRASSAGRQQHDRAPPARRHRRLERVHQAQRDAARAGRKLRERVQARLPGDLRRHPAARCAGGEPKPGPAPCAATAGRSPAAHSRDDRRQPGMDLRRVGHECGHRTSPGVARRGQPRRSDAADSRSPAMRRRRACTAASRAAPARRPAAPGRPPRNAPAAVHCAARCSATAASSPINAPCQTKCSSARPSTGTSDGEQVSHRRFSLRKRLISSRSLSVTCPLEGGEHELLAGTGEGLGISSLSRLVCSAPCACAAA